jgi:hypothetical protein
MRAKYQQKSIPWPDLGDPPNHLSQRQKNFHEILRLAVMGVTLSYYRLLESIRQMEFPPEDGRNNICRKSVVWTDVLSVVDNCKRLLVAIDNYPGLSRGFFAPFREKFTAAELFRNHYQHLEKMGDPNYTNLPWGMLSWVFTFSDSPTGFSVQSMIPGFVPQKTTEIKGPPLPLFNMPNRTIPIGIVQLGLGKDEYLNLTELAEAIPRIVRGYKSSLAEIRKDKFES